MSNIKGNVYITKNNEKIQFIPSTTYTQVKKNDTSSITLEQEIESLRQCIMKLSKILGNEIPQDSDITTIVTNIDTFYNSLQEDNLNVIYGSNNNKPVIIQK